MPDFGIFRGFNDKLFGDKLYAGQLPTQLGIIGSQNVSDFLLDVYTQSAAAFSLRLLKSEYIGSAIRVRRSSDNAEQDIGFLDKNLNTSQITTFCNGTNGFVTTWYDQSGNNINLTQTTLNLQPQIVTSGDLLLVNNKPSINFVDRFLTYVLPVANLYVFTVSKVNFALRLNTLLNTTANSADSGNIRIQAANYYRAPSTLESVPSDYTDITGHMYFNGIIHTIADNATNQHLLSAKRGIIALNTGLTVGSSLSNFRIYNGQVQEIIFYTFDQSNNRTGIETNINDFYSIY